MATTAQKSIRANMLPAGGVTSTTEAGQGQPLLPDTITLQKISQMFMERSEYNVTQLNSRTLTPGQATNFTVNNVGLGAALGLYVAGSITINKSDAGAIALACSHDFPFNILSNILVQFNGQTVIDNLSGYELLGIMAKRNKNVLLGGASSAGAAYAQANSRVDVGLANLVAGAGATFTTGANIAGVSSISCQASGDSIINFGFYLELPFTVRRDLLLGLIPMQNNSVYCNVSLTCPTLLGTTAASPLWNAALGATTTVKSTAITVYPHYFFWSIPLPNDPKLYGYLCSHSYMLLSQGNNVQSTVGVEALQYNLPVNYYLMSLLTTLRSSTGALQDITSATAGLTNLYLNYNGTARVDRQLTPVRIARQGIFYEGMPNLLGQILLDMTDVEYQSNGLCTSKWLNMYLANNPQVVADVLAAFSVSGSYSVLREQLVPANVTLV